MRWNKISILAILASLVAAGGCMEIPEHSVCASGLICPPHLKCAAKQDICIAGSCGNGVIDSAGETCDDGNLTAGDGCSQECRREAICGNGVINSGEECDDGGNNTSSCNGNCTLPVCGDGWLNPQAGEQCDDGNSVDINTCGACKLVGQLALGGSHTCMLSGDGTVRCWGEGSYGQLGYGNQDSIGDDEPPASAGNVDIGGTVIQIAAGSQHTCALLDSGSVRCWGYGAYGQLGYGNTSSIGDSSPPAWAGDVNIGGSAIQLAAGDFHTCALLDSGSVRCWGHGTSGQLGYGNTASLGHNSPPAWAGHVDVGGTVIQITAGGFHTCALLDSGSVRCWGRGIDGRLGNGQVRYGYYFTDNVGDNETPASAGNVAVGGTVIQVAAGGFHTCALLASGSVRCWGRGASGQLGYGSINNIGDDERPAAAGNVDVGGTVIQVAAGYQHTCALLDTGSVRCWGYGQYGQLGYGNINNIGDDETPAHAAHVDVGTRVVQIAAGGEHTCALLDSGAVRCWGHGVDGQLGYGNTASIGDDERPASTGNVDVGAFIPGSAGFERTGALPNANAARGWSDVLSEHLGQGSEGHRDHNEILGDALHR